MKRSILIVGALGFIVLSWMLIPGLATNMSHSAQTLGTATASISKCDPDGMAAEPVNQLIPPYDVVGVSVTQISSACGGGSLRATVDNGVTSSEGSATVGGSGGSVTVTLSSSLAMRDVLRVDVAVTK